MLDIHPSLPEAQHSKSTMDYSTYLLSASPPSSSFDLINFSSHSVLAHMNIGNNSLPFDSFTSYTPPESFQSIQMAQSGPSHFARRKKGPLKPIIIKSDSNYSSDSEGELSSAPESPRPPSPGRSTKQVSFADNKGLALAQVRLMKEGPDDPPTLSPELISSLTAGANADVTLKPPIKLCFSQPASDYLAFRDKICKQLVSLENVILRDYTVEGTIKVKNITFEKRVFVRLSIDHWESYQDIETTFVKAMGGGYAELFDTFSFKMEICPTFDITKKLQFCVCFEENGNQHWDNNNGENYTLVSELYDECAFRLPGTPKYFERFLPEKTTDSWSEFSVWRDVDSTKSPYY